MAKNRRKTTLADASEVKEHRHSTNPFRFGWEPETETKYRRSNAAKDSKLYNDEGKEVEGILSKPYERDTGRFIRIAYFALAELSHLSATARVVLDFAMSQALPDNDVVFLPPADGMEFGRFNQSKSFYNGIAELIVYEYLARTEKKQYYFINPQKWFNGKRTSIKSRFVAPKAQSG